MQQFTKKEVQRIERAVAQVEKKTTAEIVPLVVGAADDYRAGVLLWGIVGMVIASIFALTHAFSASTMFYGQIMCFFALAFMAVFFPQIRLMVLPHAYIAREVKERAQRAFFEKGIGRTTGRTGVLIAVFLAERRVEVVADQSVAQKVIDDVWQTAANIVIVHAQERDVANGLAEAILYIGDVLAKKLPRKHKKTKNELSDSLSYIA